MKHANERLRFSKIWSRPTHWKLTAPELPGNLAIEAWGSHPRHTGMWSARLYDRPFRCVAWAGSKTREDAVRRVLAVVDFMEGE